MRIALEPHLEELARQNAWFVFSCSGGKDSGASMHAACQWLDSVGHDPAKRLALHADLGRAEWPDTLDTVQKVANHCGVPLETVTQKNDLVWRFQDRWKRSLARYQNLETIQLVPPWSSSSLLFCRSEQKEVTLCKYKKDLDGDLPIVGVIGIRREESTRRANAPVFHADNALLRRNKREGYLWNPIVEWTTEEVFQYHRDHNIPLHRAYGLGSTRLSCALCVLGSKNDIGVSIAAGNHDVLASYIELELTSAFSFQSNAWLADRAPDGMVDVSRLENAKRIAAERQRLQESMPPTLRKSKSINGISRNDAVTLANIRGQICALYDISTPYDSVDAIIALAASK